MSKKDGLMRFKDAQEHTYSRALKEIKEGCKQSHWMWYIFPQIQGLGSSFSARHYAIRDLEEARAYLADELLRVRLLTICRALLELESDDITEVMGYPDDLKLRSSMTLFKRAAGDDVPFPEFGLILEKFYQGEEDRRTLEILGVLEQERE